MKPDFEKGNGLLPTVVQDAETKDVLMVAWMNELIQVKPEGPACHTGRTSCFFNEVERS